MPRMEKPLFFNNGPDRLFGFVHQPDHVQAREGIVLCHAFGEEKLWSQRVYVNFAREAAKRGIAVFRFDFRGHGDSVGHSEENTLENFASDIDAAIRQFRLECPGIQNLGLLGLRFGGSLVALYAANNDFNGRIALWEPVINGDRYMQELLRINLSTQLAVHGKVTKNRKALVDDMTKGIYANVDGYLISFDLFSECNEVDLQKVAASCTGARSLVVQIAPNINQKDREDLLNLAQRFPAGKFLKVEEPPFWREVKPFTSRTNELISKTIDWWEHEDE